MAHSITKGLPAALRGDRPDDDLKPVVDLGEFTTEQITEVLARMSQEDRATLIIAAIRRAGAAAAAKANNPLLGRDTRPLPEATHPALTSWRGAEWHPNDDIKHVADLGEITVERITAAIARMKPEDRLEVSIAASRLAGIGRTY